MNRSTRAQISIVIVLTLVACFAAPLVVEVAR